MWRLNTGELWRLVQWVVVVSAHQALADLKITGAQWCWKEKEQ